LQVGATVSFDPVPGSNTLLYYYQRVA
jgi:hypothetical protein